MDPWLGLEERKEGVKKGKGMSRHHEAGLRVPVKPYMAARGYLDFLPKPK